ncbi:hypothetical protein GQ600_5665 [Phytophthora cactorum]|nr:hypothetical protein GQ600_5665 [Phytophthora cactorum]
MMAVLGADALNTEKFTKWDTRQCVLGLEFGSVTEQTRISLRQCQGKCTNPSWVASGTWRHASRQRPFLANVGVTCIAFNCSSNRSDAARPAVVVARAAHTPPEWGAPRVLQHAPAARFVVEMDAAVYGPCALDTSSKVGLTYRFPITSEA